MKAATLDPDFAGASRDPAGGLAPTRPTREAVAVLENYRFCHPEPASRRNWNGVSRVGAGSQPPRSQ